jgi:hypothetical protein
VRAPVRARKAGDDLGDVRPKGRCDQTTGAAPNANASAERWPRTMHSAYVAESFSLLARSAARGIGDREDRVDDAGVELGASVLEKLGPRVFERHRCSV